MKHPKTAALSGLLVSKQPVSKQPASRQTDSKHGAAGPPRPEHPGLEAAQSPLASVHAEAATERAYYKALTLKVDKDRFIRLKNLGVETNQRSQALMTEALDLLFTKHRM